MDKTYADMVKQIEQLQQEAEELKAKEIEGVVARIKEAIQVYGLTAADLGLVGAGRPGRPPGARKAAPGRKPGRKPGKKAAAGAAAFADKNGNTWSGRGKRPNWLREQLAAGRTLDEFATAKR